MNETTRNILNSDPVATAKALIDKSLKDRNKETDGMATLELAMPTNQAKREHLESIEDTYFGTTWQTFIEVAKAYGFKSGYCQKFTGTGWSDKGVEEEEIIFFHEEKGLILHAESFGRTSVNSAKVYGEVKINDGKLEKNQWDALNGCSFGDNGNGTMHFDVDVRVGFRFHLDALSAFEFSKSWTTVPFLWFLNYMDTKDKNYSYEEINNKKIIASSPEVRQIIFG